MIDSIIANWIGQHDKVININPYIKIQRHESSNGLTNCINTIKIVYRRLCQTSHSEKKPWKVQRLDTTGITKRQNITKFCINTIRFVYRSLGQTSHSEKKPWKVQRLQTTGITKRRNITKLAMKSTKTYTMESQNVWT